MEGEKAVYRLDGKGQGVSGYTLLIEVIKGLVLQDATQDK
jgi:hypothetical protein